MLWPLMQIAVALILVNTIVREVFSDCKSVLDVIVCFHKAKETQQMGIVLGLAVAINGVYEQINACLILLTGHGVP